MRSVFPLDRAAEFSDIGELVSGCTESTLKRVGAKYRLWVTRESHTKISLYEADAVTGPYTLTGDLTVSGSPVTGAFHNVHLIGETYYIVYSSGWHIYAGTLDATGIEITLVNSGNPILDQDTSISWESSGCLCNPALAYRDETWYLLYECWGATGARNQLGLASGSSLTALSRYVGNPVLTGGYHRIRCGNPEIAEQDDYFVIIFGVWQDDYAEDSHIICLKTTDFVSFTDEKLLRRGLIGHNQCDPSIYEEGGDTYMTYYDNSPASVYLSRGRIDL